eukprot:CAMPEP_0204875360 /NCGR_PEP_ID=MMETSP1348-20121228/45676_1 /ASSEMBLY_ACC=CAM_ASM_000700 /TAXON_ID=215587 /ORGANISM="Aplanochytrium stocchinoi, Strain GSBS06" /LENGTH=828 /DNA_ID=CAMNT_0052031735 /DNA_START=61 /DNA_END=2547 /DNA_ORIENTATION=+
MSMQAPWNREKIMIVGQKGSGKTTVTRALLGKGFKIEDSYRPTVGANILKVCSRGKFWRWQLERETEEGVVDYLTDMAMKICANHTETKSFVEAMRLKNQQAQAPKQKQSTRKISFELRETLINESVTLDGERRVGSVVSDAPTRGNGGSQRARGEKKPNGRVSVVPSGRPTRVSVLPSRNTKAKTKTRTKKREKEVSPNQSNNADRIGGSEYIKPGAGLDDSTTNDEDDHETWNTPDPQRVVKMQSFQSVVTNVDDDLERDFDEKLLMSMKTDKGVMKYSLWDFAGQTAFHSLHQLFLTRGIYIVVFSLLEFQTNVRECAQQLEFWLTSINFHAPESRILIVATNLDKVVNKEFTLRVINRDLKKRLSSFPESRFPIDMIVKNPANYHIFFPVNNLTSDGIERLRSTVDREARKQPYVTEKITLRWAALLDSLRLDRERYRIPHRRDMNTVKALANRVGITEPKEVEAALRFLHQAGLILHLPALNDYVICDPQWLVDSMYAVIRENHLSDQGGMDVDKKIKENEELLFKTALATDELMNSLWEEEEYGFLKEFLRRTFLLSPWSFGLINNENNDSIYESVSYDELYLIPSMLKDESPRVPYGHRCLFDFSDKCLPDGTFQRLLCLCISEASGHRSADLEKEKPALHISWGKIPIYVNENDSESKPQEVFYLVHNKGDKILLVVEDRFRHVAKNCFELISELIHQINRETMNGCLEWTVWFERISKYISETAAKFIKHSPWYGDLENVNGPDKETDVLTSEVPAGSDIEDIENVRDESFGSISEYLGISEEDYDEEMFSDMRSSTKVMEEFDLNEILQIDLYRTRSR